MNRNDLERRLARVDHEIDCAAQQLRCHRELITKAESTGRDLEDARKMLKALEASQAFRLADRDLLRQELALFRQGLKKIW
ncbi:MAG: hypothetical protein JO094_05440 [Hyphomicrobiales bacterium]|nr:hypothetical protein [Hyphomicrobiales bacterium]